VWWYKEEGQERIAEGLSEERTERIEGQRFRERRRFFSFFFVVPRSIQEGTARVRICGADGDPSSSNKGGNFDFFGDFLSSPVRDPPTFWLVPLL
jgi:hypothetical protein